MSLIALANLQFRLINAPHSRKPKDPSATFHLRAQPSTDYWRKPPNLDVSTAPSFLAKLPLANFHRARVTVDAKWTRLYDQGGLLILLPQYVPGPGGDTTMKRQCWIKTGIEFFNSQANLSTVATREAADWSLLPVESSSVTIEIERQRSNAKEGLGPSLWVYLVDGDVRMAVREITWAFEHLEGDVQVGVYAARPTKLESDSSDADAAADELSVEFSSLVIE